MRYIMTKFNCVAVLLLLSHATLGEFKRARACDLAVVPGLAKCTYFHAMRCCNARAGAIGQEGAPPPALTGGQSSPPVTADRPLLRAARSAKVSADSTEKSEKIDALDSDVQWRDGATHVTSSRTGPASRKGVTLAARPSPPMAERTNTISQPPEAPWSPAVPFSPDAPWSPERFSERAQGASPPFKSSPPAAPWSPDVPPETDYDFSVPAPPFYPDAPWSPDAPWAPEHSSEVPRDSTSPEEPCTPDEFWSPEHSPEPSPDFFSPQAPFSPDAPLGSPDPSGGAASPSTSPEAPRTSSPRAKRSQGSEIPSSPTSDVQISTELRGKQLIVTLTRFPTDEDVERNVQPVTHKYVITLPENPAGPVEVLHARAAPEST